LNTSASQAQKDQTERLASIPNSAFIQTPQQHPPRRTTMRKTANKTAQQLDKLLAQIALDHLFIETLTTRNSDSLDFHDVSVWGVKSALMAAYQAGLAAEQNTAAKTADQPTSQQAA
jgi:hypothetical protein